MAFKLTFRLTKKNVLVFVLIISAVIVLAVAGYYLYFQRRPQKVVRTMTGKMLNVKSFHYQANFVMKADTHATSSSKQSTNPLLSLQKLNADLSASGDVTMLTHPNISSIFDLKLNQKSIELSLVKGEVRKINDNIYFKLNHLLQFGILDLDRVENKWFVVNPKDYPKNSKLNIDYQNLLKEIQNKLTLKQKKQLVDLAEKTNFLIITGVMSNQSINGINAYHYSYRFNSLALRNFLSEARDILRSKDLSPREKLQIYEGLARLGTAKGELWIGKDDKMLYKMTTNYDFILDNEEKQKVNLAVSVILSQFNKPVSITIPQNAHTLKEFDDLLSSFSLSPRDTTSSTSSVSTTSNKQSE